MIIELLLFIIVVTLLLPLAIIGLIFAAAFIVDVCALIKERLA